MESAVLVLNHRPWSTNFDRMSTQSTEPPEEENEGGSRSSLIISSLFCAIWGVFLALQLSDPDGPWAFPQTMLQVCVISIVIWQVCDPFADAAQWVGVRFRLPGSVRGATLDAVASSMPELFSGIFFVVLALQTVSSGDADLAARERITAAAEGYGATIATCAGSAVYNMILIPAFCALVISFVRPARPTIDVEDEVISRDGVWFLSTQILLIMFLYQEKMMWWMGVCLLAVYTVYIAQLYFDAKRYQRCMDFLGGYLKEHGADTPIPDVIAAAAEQRLRLNANIVLCAQQAYGCDADEDATDDSAGLFFGYVNVRLSGPVAAAILLVATLIAAAACYFLVEATMETAAILEVPTFFVAVILAAAASSVPDTFLAIAAARRGDDSGAVSNAFGSNIFDICICLSIPLLVNSWMTDWQPVSLLQDGRPIPGIVGLRVLLVFLTVVNLAIMWHERQITRFKAVVMCGLYIVFVAYAVLGSLGFIS